VCCSVLQYVAACRSKVLLWDVRGLTHGCAWRDLIRSVTRLIHMSDMTFPYYGGHDSFLCGTGLILKCDVTHSYV